MRGDIDIIDNYRDLTIGAWAEIARITKDKDKEEIDIQVQVLSVLTGKSEAFLLNLPLDEYSNLARRMQFLEFVLPDFFQGVSEVYKLDGIELVPVTDRRKVTTAQYVDFQSFHQAGRDEYIVEILSCLLVPKGKKYSQDYDIAEVQDAIRNGMNVYEAMSLYGFFYALVHQINEGFVNLFGLDEEQGADEEGDEDGFAQKWGWISNVDMVSDACRCSWDEVWQMTALEFLNIIAYCKDKAEREKAEIDKWKRTH